LVHDVRHRQGERDIDTTFLNGFTSKVQATHTSKNFLHSASLVSSMAVPLTALDIQLADGLRLNDGHLLYEFVSTTRHAMLASNRLLEAIARATLPTPPVDGQTELRMTAILNFLRGSPPLFEVGDIAPPPGRPASPNGISFAWGKVPILLRLAACIPQLCG
jgi:hypothetical protein